MKIVIRKATMKGSLFLSYSFDQIEPDVKNRINTNSDAPIHDDLRNAFRRLIPHFAFISEEVEDDDLVKRAIENPEDYLFNKDESKDETFFKFRAFEFEITEKDGYEKIKITGAKQLETTNEIIFSIPPIGLGDDSYVFYKELEMCVEHLKEEVAAYMQGKTAPKAQIEMFDDGDDFGENEEEI